MKTFAGSKFGIVIFESDAEEKKQLGEFYRKTTSVYAIQGVPRTSGEKLDLIFAVNQKRLGEVKKEIIASCNTYLRGDLYDKTGLGMAPDSTDADKAIMSMEMAQVIGQIWTSIILVTENQLREFSEVGDFSKL